MAKPKSSSTPIKVEPLSLEQLEAGLRAMSDGNTDLGAFWDANIASFRQTVLFAIRETSDALLSPTITRPWRVELETQLEELIQYIEMADRYIERRALTGEGAVLPLAPARARIH
jgi:hypothetical protein